jgi:hypothetical protein
MTFVHSPSGKEKFACKKRHVDTTYCMKCQGKRVLLENSRFFFKISRETEACFSIGNATNLFERKKDLKIAKNHFIIATF